MATLRLRTSQRQQQPAQQNTQYSVKAVKGWLVPHYWEFVRKYIGDALEHANGELELEDIYQYLLAERMYLFTIGSPIICGAATCEVVQYVRKKAVRVVTLGGDGFAGWKGALDKDLMRWAESIGADGVEAYVRKGMVEALQELGYKQTYVGLWHGKISGITDK